MTKIASHSLETNRTKSEFPSDSSFFGQNLSALTFLGCWNLHKFNIHNHHRPGFAQDGSRRYKDCPVTKIASKFFKEPIRNWRFYFFAYYYHHTNTPTPTQQLTASTTAAACENDGKLLRNDSENDSQRMPK